ncbi:MAG: glycosyltransferase family 4 protein, partial [Candidatus Omnitrophota bacterium]
MKVLFIEPHPIEGPSSRYRVEQYIPYVRTSGITCIVRPFVSTAFYKLLYVKGHHARKILYFIQSSIKRFFDLFTALGCDVIFLHLEAFPLGPPVFEWILARLGKKIIYDLDDAIYLGRTSPANAFMKRLKWPSKVVTILKLSKHIITCNEYLADFARQYNKNVTVIYTCVDTDQFKPVRDKGMNNGITIGWMGSHSTAVYLEPLKPVFRRLRERFDFNVRLIGVGEYRFDDAGARVDRIPWRLDTEIQELQRFTIGVYPLPADTWTLGKTGFKTIQYMSVGIPCVVSAVGSNRGIVRDGDNGFFATSEEEWVAKLSALMSDEKLRRDVGEA